VTGPASRRYVGWRCRLYPSLSQGNALLRCRNGLRELANELLAASQRRYGEAGRRLSLADMRAIARDWQRQPEHRGFPASATYRVAADLDRAFRTWFAKARQTRAKRVPPDQGHRPRARHLPQQPGRPLRRQPGVASQVRLGALEGRQSPPGPTCGAARAQDPGSALRPRLAGRGQPLDALLPVRMRAAHPCRTDDGPGCGPPAGRRNHGVGRRGVRPRHPREYGATERATPPGEARAATGAVRIRVGRPQAHARPHAQSGPKGPEPPGGSAAQDHDRRRARRPQDRSRGRQHRIAAAARIQGGVARPPTEGTAKPAETGDWQAPTRAETGEPVAETRIADAKAESPVAVCEGRNESGGLDGDAAGALKSRHLVRSRYRGVLPRAKSRSDHILFDIHDIVIAYLGE